ncbi:MAG TPA: ribosome-associated translation inhibitor RaiA [Dissulfurispiraceae bacterium]|nr:ribosome-associated translation inhibitor RaiA [Dissulfurispiraceae bacterium]
MNIIVNGRHLEITPPLRQYAEDKIGKFTKYLSNISDAIVTVSVEKHRQKTDRQKVEVLLKVNGYMIQAEGATGDVYSAIDAVVEKLEKQVVKYKEKVSAHRVKGSDKKAAAAVAVEPVREGRIIKHKKFDMKPMTPDDAVDQMGMLGKDFFVFTNLATGEMNVVYSRRDGNFGLIEPHR